MNWIQGMNKLTGPYAPLRLPAAVEVRGMLANGVQIPLAVRGVYELRDGKTGVYVTMPDEDIANEWARLSQDEGKAEREIERLRAEVAALHVEIDGLHATLKPWKEQGPWFLRANIDAAVEALRDKCIDLVAMHGGSVEIEAAIRGA